MVIGCLGVDRRAERFFSYLAILREQAGEHSETTRTVLKRLARGGFETRTLPLKGRPSSVIRESKISQVGREQGIECSHRPTLSPLLSHASCCWVPDPRHPSCS